MCELLGISTNKKIKVNELFKTFISHSIEHKNGWGMAVFDDLERIVKEPQPAINSESLYEILKSDFSTSKCIAHIRKATIGDVTEINTHPFKAVDESGRHWILAHNGTIFESEVLSPYQYTQQGSTDSERILLYIVDEMNKKYRKKGEPLTDSERIGLVDKAVRAVVPGNKLNLLIFDGDQFYVHKNEMETLFTKKVDEGIIFATKPLDDGVWEELPENRLHVYKDGAHIYTGVRHNHSYVHNEEDMKLLYLAYAGL